MLLSSRQLKDKIQSCSKCPLITQQRSRPVPGFGKDNTNVMLVGLAPGKDGADMTGIPFTRDPSGRLLDEMLHGAGISKELDVFITNVVKCNPRDKKGRNRLPSKMEVLSCSPYLKNELKIIQPKLIISLGRLASDFFLIEKGKSMLDIHGKVYNFEGRTVVPFIHPGYVIRGAYNRDKYLKEFFKVGELYRQLIEKESKLSRFDFISMTLKNSESRGMSGEIVGKTRLQKFIFLAQDRLKNIGYRGKYAFRPYFYGPFNRQLYTDIEWMEINELIEVTSDISSSGNISKYKLTQKGLDEINEFIKNNGLEDVEGIIRDTINTYQDYSLPRLLEFVHNEYDEYNYGINDNKPKKIRKLDEFLFRKEI